MGLFLRWRRAGILVLAATLVLAGCGSAATAMPTPSATPTSGSESIAAKDVTPILGTTILRKGTQRVAFLLEGQERLVEVPEVMVGARRANGDVSDTSFATFHKWPLGTRGSYVTELAFDHAGAWRLGISGEGIEGEVGLQIEVFDYSPVVDVGEQAPFSVTKTAGSVDGDLSLITSHSEPDPDLYEVTVAGALFEDRPAVIVFASPAFCTSPTCGPQVDTVIELKDAYEGRADFIHVEVYDNPDEIQGDLSRAELAPALDEWGITGIPDYVNESWVFVVDSGGLVAHRFEGYATYQELEAALVRAM